MRNALLLSLLAIIVFGLTGCSYNELTEKQQRVKGAWSNVESTMQRRADLLPNLFEAAKAAGFNEQTVFGKIADARTKLGEAQSAKPAGEEGVKTPEQKKEIWQANSDLSRLLVLFENYPQLRSNEGFLKAQDEIAGTENRINVARKDYNATVTDYNTTRNQFPAVITASMVGFPEEPYFQMDERAKDVPTLDATEMKDKK